jgi:hypothetical protein
MLLAGLICPGAKVHRLSLEHDNIFKFTGSGAHPSSYTMSTAEEGGKKAGAWSWPLSYYS